MRALILLLSFLIPLTAYSQTITFEHPCSSEVMASRHYYSGAAQSLGVLSIELLKESQIHYQGNATGINQILSTPIGLDALDIISEQEMLAWGWCFSVDGIIPEVLADQIYLQESSEVIWFFGYAHYLNGQWISQCQKANYCREAN